jgi:site-specific DNA recombinase
MNRTSSTSAKRTKRAAVYCRISDDKAGAGLGVARQRSDCEALAAARGWEVVAVFTDNSISAYSGKPRPGYESMLAAAEADEYDVIVAWHTDRLHRSPRDLEGFIDVIERARITVATVKAGDMDLATPSGRMVARMLGAAARHESEHKADRLRRKMLEKAQRGEPTGSRRPYGFEPDKITHREPEADVIREVADRILAGETCFGIARDLNSRGIPSASGGRWASNSLKRIMVSPRIAGLRQHLPRETGTREANGGLFREGDLYAAVWKPIIPRRKWDRVRELADPVEQRRVQRGRTYMLTGLLFCHACGRHLVGQPSGGQPAYQCALAAGGCGKVCAKAEPLEQWIEDVVRMRIAEGDLNKRQPQEDGGELARLWAERDEVRTELAAIDEDRAEGRMVRARWSRMNAAMTKREQGLTSRINRLEAAQDRVGWDAERWAIEWHRDEDAARRGAMLRAVLQPVTVGPAPRGRARPCDRLQDFPQWIG